MISCGAGNSYGHPDMDVMEKLKAMEIGVFRSDKQETVIAKSDGKTITWDKEPCNDYSPGDPEDQGTLPTGGSSGDGNAAGAGADMVQEPAQGEMVWKSAMGSKYHKVNDCGKMNPSNAVQLLKEEAKGQGLEACAKCY